MSKLLWWQAENFMSITQAKCEFDEKNIINLKGYNDSGKSAMLTALKVLMTNCNPTKQLDFIQDGKDYFRILAMFDDNVMILRDKYVNGQSLYEMYKDGTVIYSTKQPNGTLTPLKGMPQPIADYLGLITYEDVTVNARACFEKQIGVQTTGSENYKLFNNILKSEEIANASAMLNADKNKLVASINGVSSDINTYNDFIRGKTQLCLEHIEALKALDTKVDEADTKLNEIDTITNVQKQANNIVITPELESVSNDRLVELSDLQGIVLELKDISITPQLDSVDNTRLTEISNIIAIKNSMTGIPETFDKEIPELEPDKLNAVMSLVSMVTELANIEKALATGETEIKRVVSELDDYAEQLKAINATFIKCPGCGLLFTDEAEHAAHTH